MLALDITKKEDLCPKCGGNLDKGYIQTSLVALAWSPISKKKNPYVRFYWTVDTDEIKLGKWTYVKGSKVLADNCRQCRVVTISY